MTTFFLIRHAKNDFVKNSIAGRRPGVHLNAEGRAQAERLAQGLAHEPIRHIFSSPLERARETAEPLARKLGINVQIAEPLIEIDFADWTGRSFAELEHDEEWRRWNHFRSGTRVPHGEFSIEIQARVVREMYRLRQEFPNDSIALVSHGDPLRSAVAYWMGMPLDALQRLVISPASVTILTLDDWGAQLLGLNRTFDAE